jgi:hypothetical protein
MISSASRYDSHTSDTSSTVQPPSTKAWVKPTLDRLSLKSALTATGSGGDSTSGAS